MDDQPVSKAWYTVQQIANHLEVHEQTVRRWIKEGALRAYAFGDRAGYRVSAEDLAAFMDRRRTGHASE